MNQNNTFIIAIDRIEGEYAVCEFPENEMKDIKISTIPFEVKEKELLIVRYSSSNELEIISKVPKSPKKRIIPRLIRFN